MNKQMSFEKLCTYDEIRAMNNNDRNLYLDNLYNGNTTHKIYARVDRINNKQIDISGIYYLMDDNKAYYYRSYKDDANKTTLSVKCNKKNKAKFAEIVKGLKLGDHIVCHIEANPDYSDKDNLITFDPATICKEVSDLGKMLEKNGLSLDLSDAYVTLDNKTLLMGEVEKKCKKILSSFLSEKDKVEKEIIKAKKEIETIDDELKSKIIEQERKLRENYKTELKKIESQLNDDKIKRNNEHKKEMNMLKNELEKKKKEISFLSKYIDIYNCDIALENAKNDLSTYKEFNTFDEMLNCTQKILKTKYGLGYKKEVIASMYIGLQTDQLLLLVGRPGTGKTSFIEAFPKVFNFDNTAVIPVQPNWTDKSDLLGYYNPIEKNYISTPFLDSLLNFVENAKRNKDKIYFICLDEMNLSHVEYYFAEFLSKLQCDRKIQLYSKDIFCDVISEIKDNALRDSSKFYEKVNEYTYSEEFNNLTFEEKKYYFEIRKMAKMISKYPYEIEIPRNIKFIGTLNQDETTMDISPKVLDRSFVIRLENQNADKIVFDDTKIDYCIKYKPLTEYDNIYNLENANYKNNAIIEEIQSVTHYSQRCINIFLVNPAINDWCNCMGMDQYIDLIISCTVLPKIRIRDKEYKQKIKQIGGLVENHPISNYLFKVIDNNNDRELDYWSY